MDLSHPAASVMPARDAVVLEVLAGTESSLSMTQLWKLSHYGARAGLYPAVERLVASGLVLADGHTRAISYRLNREHVLAPAVLAAVGARRVLFERLEQAVAALAPTPVHASVFGSVARREAGNDSDIDLCLVVDDAVDITSESWTDQLLALETSVAAWSGNHLEYLVFSLADLPRVAGEAVVAAIVTDGRLLSGRALDELLPQATTPPG